MILSKKFPLKKSAVKEFHGLILEWGSKNTIDYPWRRERTPYRVLISEILLTRTKAAQVEPVYLKFMEKYPTVEKFLKMEVKTVKVLIQSLGLLFRADTLKTISKQLREDYDSKIPSDLKDLKALKGIGNYGANAILCFGYGKKRPILDSNFIRIYERLFEVKSISKTAKTDKFLWNFSEKILPEEDYVLYNYSLLDLGGSICLPRKPDCQKCHLQSICSYYNYYC